MSVNLQRKKNPLTWCPIFLLFIIFLLLLRSVTPLLLEQPIRDPQEDPFFFFWSGKTGNSFRK